jgi:hypothetical protein
MALIVAPSLVEPMARGLLGCVSANEGPTLEQQRLLQAFVSHLWSRPDIAVNRLEPITAGELGSCLVDREDRQTFHQLQVTLEFCRHPQTPEQLQLGEAYAEALGVSSAARMVANDLLHKGMDKAADAVAARKDDAPAAHHAALTKIAGWGSCSDGGGLIHTTAG